MLRALVASLVLLVSTVASMPTAVSAATSSAPSQTEVLTLGGGCFWCMEAVFAELKGVVSVESGYAGGSVVHPTYTQVSSGTTGHAEVVQVSFDPGVISRSDILRVFFTVHDPTTRDRQGNDVGPQYRSIAFYRTPEQKAAIEQIIAETAASHEWDGKIVTEVVPYDIFYKAENYHQEYFALHGEQPYCQLVIAPKIAKFRKRYHNLLKIAA